MSILFPKTNRRKKEILAAIDIGGSKVCCAIAKLNDQNIGETLKVIGIGHQSSKGIKNGIITNIEELQDSIVNAVHSAEQMAGGDTIKEVYVNLASSCTQSHTVEVEIALNGQMIDESQIRHLISLAHASFKKPESQIIHVLPIAYALDDIKGIKDPRGLVGHKLTATFHLISAQLSFVQNITNCIGRCHLDVSGFVVSPYASGLSSLEEDELELGVTIVDLGATHSSIASFLGGSLIYIDSISLGGWHITSDIARTFSTALIQAERLKTLYGTTLVSSADEREMITFSQLGEGKNQISKSLLTQVIQARVEETLEMIWKRLQYSGIDCLVCQRLVLTGGGSQLPGIRELASTIWGSHVRIGSPKGILGVSDIVTMPLFSTCGGLLKFALRDYVGYQDQIYSSHKGGGFFPRMIQWVRENF